MPNKSCQHQGLQKNSIQQHYSDIFSTGIFWNFYPKQFKICSGYRVKTKIEK